MPPDTQTVGVNRQLKAELEAHPLVSGGLPMKRVLEILIVDFLNDEDYEKTWFEKSTARNEWFEELRS